MNQRLSKIRLPMNITRWPLLLKTGRCNRSLRLHATTLKHLTRARLSMSLRTHRRPVSLRTHRRPVSLRAAAKQSQDLTTGPNRTTRDCRSHPDKRHRDSFAMTAGHPTRAKRPLSLRTHRRTVSLRAQRSNLKTLRPDRIVRQEIAAA